MASEIVPNAISPLLPDFFVSAALAASAPLAALIGNRFAPARDGFEPGELIGEGAAPESAWPYVLFGPSEDGSFDQYAQTGVLLDAPFLVRAFMREDVAIARGQDFEDATGAICTQLQSALSGFGPLEVVIGGAVLGTVHGCELLRALHRRTYGERGRRVSEMGVRVLISCS